MSRISRGIKYAIRAAKLSVCDMRVGAAIFRGPCLISIGWNIGRTHPKSRTRNNCQHAEFSALIGTTKSAIAGCDIFVVRVSKLNNLRMAKPCDFCSRLIGAAGIRRVYFTDHSGNINSYRVMT